MELMETGHDVQTYSMYLGALARLFGVMLKFLLSLYIYIYILFVHGLKWCFWRRGTDNNKSSMQKILEIPTLQNSQHGREIRPISNATSTYIVSERL